MVKVNPATQYQPTEILQTGVVESGNAQEQSTKWYVQHGVLPKIGSDNQLGVDAFFNHMQANPIRPASTESGKYENMKWGDVVGSGPQAYDLSRLRQDIRDYRLSQEYEQYKQFKSSSEYAEYKKIKDSNDYKVAVEESKKPEPDQQKVEALRVMNEKLEALNPNSVNVDKFENSNSPDFIDSAKIRKLKPEEVYRLSNIIEMSIGELKDGIFNSDQPRHMFEYSVAAIDRFRSKEKGIDKYDRAQSFAMRNENPLVVVMEEVVIPKLKESPEYSGSKTEFWKPDGENGGLDWGRKMGKDRDFANALFSTVQSISKANFGGEIFDPDEMRKQVWIMEANASESFVHDELAEVRGIGEAAARKALGFGDKDKLSADELARVSQYIEEKAKGLMKKALERGGLDIPASEMIERYVEVWDQAHAGKTEVNPFKKILEESIDHGTFAYEGEQNGQIVPKNLEYDELFEASPLFGVIPLDDQTGHKDSAGSFHPGFQKLLLDNLNGTSAATGEPDDDEEPPEADKPPQKKELPKQHDKPPRRDKADVHEDKGLPWWAWFMIL